jgi:hypothetical protein
MKILFGVMICFAVLQGLHFLSYRFLKKRIVSRQRWGLNFCCGKTDGKGINADIARHTDLPKFVIVDIYQLPFKSNQFKSVLSSHTIEHVNQPKRFYHELQRVGQDVTLVIPPLWDMSAMVNLIEHRWIFLSFCKEHKDMPRYVRLPFAREVQKYLGQRIRA